MSVSEVEVQITPILQLQNNKVKGLFHVLGILRDEPCYKRFNENIYAEINLEDENGNNILIKVWNQQINKIGEDGDITMLMYSCFGLEYEDSPYISVNAKSIIIQIKDKSQLHPNHHNLFDKLTEWNKFINNQPKPFLPSKKIRKDYEQLQRDL